MLYGVLLPLRCIRSEHGDAVEIGMYVGRIYANCNVSDSVCYIRSATLWNVHSVFWKNCYSKEAPDSGGRLQ